MPHCSEMDGKGYASVCPDIGINWKAKTCLGAQMVILPLGKAWRWGHKEDPWSPESKTFSSRSWSHKEASSIATVVQQLEGHYSFRFSWVLRFPDCLRSQTTSIIRKSFAPFPQRNAHTYTQKYVILFQGLPKLFEVHPQAPVEELLFYVKTKS